MSMLDLNNNNVIAMTSDDINQNDASFSRKTEALDILHNELNQENEQQHHQNSKIIAKTKELYQEKSSEFKEVNDISKLKQVYINNKQEQLKDFNSLIKKNKQDYTYKINSFEREYLARTKEIEADIKELKKNYNNKVSELKRKLDHDIKRITDLAKRKSSPLDKELLVVNEPIHIKTINNEIKNIRRETIEEIYHINKDSLEAQQALEIEFVQNTIDKETEINIFRSQLDIKIAEIKEKIELLNIDEKINSASYDFNYEEILINNEKENLVTLNEYEKEFLIELVNIQKEYSYSLYQLDLKQFDIVCKYQEIIAQHLDSEITRILQDKEQMYEVFLKKINDISVLITNLVETLEHTIKDKVSMTKMELINYNDQFLTKSVVNESKRYNWEIFDYKFNYLLFTDEIKLYQTQQNKRLEKYYKELSSQIKSLNNLLNCILKSFNDFIETEIDSDRTFMKKYISHHQDVMNNATEIIDNKKINLNAKYNNTVTELENKINNLNSNYEANRQVILEQFKNNIIAYQNRMKNFDSEIVAQKNDLSARTAFEIYQTRQKIKNFNATKKQLIKEKTNKIKEKYQEKQRNILQEKKEQIKLL